MRGGYRGKPKPKLPSHLKRVHVNARIQKWMLDELKRKGALFHFVWVSHFYALIE